MQDEMNSDLTNEGKILLLEASDWTNNLNTQQIERLAEYFKCSLMQSNTNLIKEGEANNFLGLICEGQVNIVKENSAGEKINLQTLGKGKIIGEVSFFDHGPSSASVVTKTDVIILILERNAFNKLCEEAPAIALTTILNIIPTLCQRLRQTTGKLIDRLQQKE